MKFQAAAVFSIVICSIKGGGVEGKIHVDDDVSALDMVSEIATKLMGDQKHIIHKDTVKLIGDKECSGIFSQGKDAMVHNQDFDYSYKSEERNYADVEEQFPDRGIILSTGLAAKMEENIRNDDSDNELHTPGDAYLNKILGQNSTEDACVLEFSFTAPENVTDLYFEYLFGSDEYNDFVGEEYYDIFALVLNGENIAIVPNTDNTHVSIDTVNKGETGDEVGKNGKYFVNNHRTRHGGKNDKISPYHEFAPNGFTRMLEATGKVNTKANNINTVSFRIADVKDTEMDSWVMITGGSFSFDKYYQPPPQTESPVVSPTESPVVSPTESPVVSPTQDRIGLTRSPTGYVKGDPHFMTWAGEAYDFHGVCDMVLLHAGTIGKGIGMEIHVRSNKMKMWSYVSSAAVRIGQDIFEVIGGSESKFLTNGAEEEVKSTEDGISLVSTISGFPIHKIRESRKGDKFAINLGNNEKVLISVWHLFVSVSFENPRSESFQDSVGLLGSFSGGLKLARDGTTIIKDLNEYGKEWQVRNSEPQLFHSIEGPQYPTKCVIPSSEEMRRRLGESELTMNEAKKACDNVNEAERDLCIFDVLATSDKFTAGAY